MKTLLFASMLMTSMISFAGQVDTTDGSSIMCQAEFEGTVQSNVESGEVREATATPVN